MHLSLYIIFDIYLIFIISIIYFFSHQDKKPIKNKIETCPPLTSMLKSTNCNVPKQIEKCISTKAAQNDNSMVYSYNIAVYNIYNIM